MELMESTVKKVRKEILVVLDLKDVKEGRIQKHLKRARLRLGYQQRQLLQVLD
jgi:hypothetical protein